MCSASLSGFGWVLTLGAIALILSFNRSSEPRNPDPDAKTPAPTPHPSKLNPQPAPMDVDLLQQLKTLQQRYYLLQEELRHQESRLQAEFQATTFEQLQTLFINYPSVRQMTQHKPDLLAKHLMPLFTPLENILRDWGYEPIATPWEKVPFDPQLHQPDATDIAPGDPVYVRFVGYRQGDRILCPAKVSRTLPHAAMS